METVYIKHKSTPEFLQEVQDLGVKLFYITGCVDYVGYFPDDNYATDGHVHNRLASEARGDEYIESKDEFFKLIKELQIEYGYRDANGELV